jgi:hypothetical protein
MSSDVAHDIMVTSHMDMSFDVIHLQEHLFIMIASFNSIDFNAICT